MLGGSEVWAARGLGLILAFLTRIAAFGIAANIVVATARCAMPSLVGKGPRFRTFDDNAGMLNSFAH
jgi:hypothetical protein